MLGRDGEKSMAQYLNSVSREGKDIYIYHDIVNQNNGNPYNIDHIVVSREGIFIIDTKTYSKQKNITNTIESKDGFLYKNKQKISDNLPLKIKNQSQWLRSELRKKLGVDYEITRIIAFIGWYVSGEKIDNTYIANAKNIRNIFKNQFLKEKFDKEELKRITSALHDMASQNSKTKHLCCS